MNRIFAVAIVLFASLGAIAQTNVMRDCPGVVGDGLTDDCSALQACIDVNAGRHMIFNRNNNGANGDYHIACPALKMKGQYQWLDADVEGVKIRSDHGCILSTSEDGSSQNVRLSNLRCYGAAPYDPSAVGFEINSPGATMEHLEGYHFGLYDFWIHSGLHSSADLFRLRDSQATWAGSDGVRIEGGDAQAGLTENLSVTNNLGYGLNDSSFLGNTHIQPHSRSNGLGGYFCKGNPMVTTFVNPYSEQDQPMNVYKVGCIVVGGVDGAGHDPQQGAFFLDNQGYVGTGMVFKNWAGNVLNRLQSNGNYIIGASAAGTEQWRISMLAGYFAISSLRNDFMIDRISGTVYWGGTKQRHGANVYEDWTAKTVGAGCGTTDGISWNPAPAAGDPVGWRCIGNTWHAFGAIQ